MKHLTRIAICGALLLTATAHASESAVISDVKPAVAPLYPLPALKNGTLDLSNRGINDDALLELVQKLPDETIYLNLSHNTIGDNKNAGIWALVLGTPSRLKSVDLSYNQINKEGERVLMNRLPRTVDLINLTGNPCELVVN